MKSAYITLASDPASYGSACTADEAATINGTLRRAAELAGIDWHLDPGRAEKRALEESPAVELDWFSQAMSGGWEWSAEQWAAWIAAEIMTTENKVRILSTLTTRDSAGRHFTTRVGSDEIAALETAGLIKVSRPIHEATGIPYAAEHWSVTVTDKGIELVDAYPEYHSAP